MKRTFLTLTLILISMGLMKSQGNSGGVCTNIISKYDGVRNSNQLEKLLNESTSPVITGLDAGTKASLVAFMIFDKGRPAGMLEVDQNIEKLYANPSVAEAVFSVIFGAPTLFVSFDTKPKVIDISVSDFMAMVNSDPAKFAAVGVPSWCYNCYSKNLDPCCEVGGKGCWDEYTSSNRVLYKVHP